MFNIRFALLCLAILAFACSKNRLEDVGQSTEALDGGSVVSIISPGNSPSIVAAQTKLAMAFTGSGTFVPTRWASFNGTTWSVCDVNSVPSSCNGGVTPVATGQTNWNGKGAVAADGNGNVVYVTLGSDADSSTTSDLVLAMLSTTNGVTYTHQAVIVNASGGECDPATEDMPDVTADLTTSPATFWFVWRHNGAGNFGACVRRAQISGASLVFLDEARSVGGLDKEDDGSLTMGQGGLRIAAGDGIVSIGYSNNDELQSCPSTSLISMAWGSVSSFNNGVDWSNTSVAYHTDHFLSCPLGSIQNGIRAFDFIRSQDGNYYLAVADWDSTGTTATLHLFMNEGGATAVPGFPSDSHVWREFCPGFQDTLDGGPMTGAPTGNWTRPGTLCSSASFPTFSLIMLPTLASDGQNRLSLLYYEGTGTTSIHPVYRGNFTPRTATSTFESIDPLDSNSSSPSGSIFLNHLAMTAWSAQSPDSCSSTGDFYPVWLFARSTTQTLKTRRVSP